MKCRYRTFVTGFSSCLSPVDQQQPVSNYCGFMGVISQCPPRPYPRVWYPSGLQPNPTRSKVMGRTEFGLTRVNGRALASGQLRCYCLWSNHVVHVGGTPSICLPCSRSPSFADRGKVTDGTLVRHGSGYAIGNRSSRRSGWVGGQRADDGGLISTMQ